MKKLLLFGSLLLLIAINTSKTESQTSGDAPPNTSGAVTWEIPDSVIDNIAIPYDVLAYAQTEYQGYAVTKASKSSRGGQQIYRLTVDKDDQPYNNPIIYLLYDMNWQLLGEERGMPKSPETKPLEQPQPTAEAPVVDDEQDEEEPEEEVDEEGEEEPSEPVPEEPAPRRP